MNTAKLKKVKTIQDIKNDPRIHDFVKDYDGKNIHMAECKTGFNFEGGTISIGNVERICNGINNHLFANDENDYQK